MAAAGTSPALNLREKLAELAGLKQRVSPDLVRCDFTNLVTNGGMEVNSGWVDYNVPTASGQTAVQAESGTYSWYFTSDGNYDGIKSDLGFYLKGGSSYLINSSVYPVNDTGITLSLLDSVGALAGIDVTGLTMGAWNTVSETLIPSSTTSQGVVRFDTSTSWGAGTWYIDNVSIYEADPSDDAPWLRLPYGYKVGTRGMIVRDGVVLHPSDYTEITDSGQTFIKPIVAPGVSTEFSIWAGA